MIQRDQIIEQALALPPEDRVLVADALEQSLCRDTFAAPEIASEWAVEIDRRLVAYDRGEISAIPADVALDNIRKRLAERRATKVKP